MPVMRLAIASLLGTMARLNALTPSGTDKMEADSERLTDPKPVKPKSTSALKPRDGLLALAALLVVGAIAWFIVQDKDAPEAPPMVGDILVPPEALNKARDQLNAPQAPPPELTDAELAPVAAPEALDASDAQVERALEDMSPPLLAWFTPQEQVRKWVSLAVNLSDGMLLTQHRPVSYPMGTFKVKRQGDRISMDSVNFERANKLVAAVTAIPPEKLAAYYRQWSPILEDAFNELGMEGNFQTHFNALLEHALAVESLSRPPELEQPHVLYLYADDDMEQANDLDKLMWRMGPDNMNALQTYLQSFKAAL